MATPPTNTDGRSQAAQGPRLSTRGTGIDSESDPARYIAARTTALRERLTFVAERAARIDLDGVEIEDGKLFIARTPAADKPAVLADGTNLGLARMADASRGLGYLPKSLLTRGGRPHKIGFAGAWTVCEQNRLLSVCFGLPEANKA